MATTSTGKEVPVSREEQTPFARLRSRVGLPQIIALAFLLVLLAQCLWFTAHIPLSSMEGSYVESGLIRLEHLSEAGNVEHTPLVPLLAGVAARLCGAETHYVRLDQYRFWIRLPFLGATLLLGASVWYVARRLYGNIGGYVALALYSFSPAIIASSLVNPQVIGAWGAFGLIFTAIAAAHTLYAPREVILWNWRRILLMGLSIALCIAAQFSFWILLLPALGFMLWVGHVRRGAAGIIFAAACVVGLLLLFALYSFRLHAFAAAVVHANWLEPAKNIAGASNSPLFATFFLQSGLGMVLLLAVTLGSFLIWKRTRFFGTAAPLMVAILLLAFALYFQFAGFTFLFLALPFLILFMAGVSADLLESRYALAANAVVGGVLIANATIHLFWLIHLRKP